MLYFEAPKFAFAFNPIVITATSDAQTISFTANGHTITRPVTGGGALIQVQAIAQSLFDRKKFGTTLSDTTLFKKMDFTITDGTYTQTGSIDVIWGAMQFGETYTQDKVLTWFRDLPMFIPVYLSSPKTIKYRIDRGEIQTSPMLTNVPAGKWNFLADPTLFPGLESARDTLHIIVEGDEGEDAGIFDYTFDYTFRPVAKGSIFITVNIRDCAKGVYLRWINKHGEYCYYLFEDGTESNAVQNGGVNLNEFVRTLEFQSGYSAGSNRPTEKNAQKSVRLFASLVDKNTFDMLEGLPESPIVDLFMGLDSDGVGKWLGVNVAPGTFARTTATLQDFECSMLHPTTFNQSL